MSAQIAQQPFLGQVTPVAAVPNKNAFVTDPFNPSAYIFGYPSPPVSNSGSEPDADSGALPLPLDFDFDAFTNCGTHTGLEDPFRLDVDFSQPSLCPSVFSSQSPVSDISAATPVSTALVSPKASIFLSSTTTDVLPTPAAFDNKSATAFSALTTPVPAPAPVAQPVLALSPTEAEALSNHHLQRYLHYKGLAAQAEAEDQAFALQQSEQQFDALFAPFNMSMEVSTQKLDASNSVAFQPAPAQEVAAIHHAQAQAHFQAHDAAARLVAQAKTVQPQFFAPAVAMAPLVDVPAPVAPAPVVSAAPSIVTSVPASEPSPRSDIGSESDMADTSSVSDLSDSKLLTVNGLALTNLHGGGRGYVPGKTPDDPEKRHKCQICGRGFARAFNMKTHNPQRSKPHMCPHPTCRRGFSRLHDLDRHRQGIHSDGPLVDAKRKVVAPSSAAGSRIADKIQNRAEQEGLKN